MLVLPSHESRVSDSSIEGFLMARCLSSIGFLRTLGKAPPLAPPPPLPSPPSSLLVAVVAATAATTTEDEAQIHH